jgi:hypothetical protein
MDPTSGKCKWKAFLIGSIMHVIQVLAEQSQQTDRLLATSVADPL